MEIDNLKSWAIYGFFFIAISQIVLMVTILYTYFGGGNILGLLKYNFYSIFLLSVGALMFTFILIMISYIYSIKTKLTKDKTDWNDEW